MCGHCVLSGDVYTDFSWSGNFCKPVAINYTDNVPVQLLIPLANG